MHVALSTKTSDLIEKLGTNPPFGEIKKFAKEIKKDHELALDLWASGKVPARLLAILIMDNKFTQEFVDELANDILTHDPDDRNRLTDWLLANKLMKSKKSTQMIITWEDSPSPVLRRLFWYYQARLRWTGKNPLANDDVLLSSIEEKMLGEDPEVQWAMNFTTAQIGIFQVDYRERCIDLGKEFGLYVDEVVPPNCTPNYLPEFIRIEVEKKNL